MDGDDPNVFRNSRHEQLLTVNAADLLTTSPQARSWLVDPLIPRRQVTLLSGEGGVGKSFLALQLAVAVATGTEWIGYRPVQGKALFVSAEDELDEIHRRLVPMIEKMGLLPSDLRDLEIADLCQQASTLLGIPNGEGGIRPTDLFEGVREQVRRHRPTLIVIDTLSDTFGGDENKRQEARQFIRMLRELASEADSAVLVTAHPSLSGQHSGSGSSGSTAWNASVRSRLFLDCPRVKGQVMDPDIRRLSHKKSNYAPASDELLLRLDEGGFVKNIGATSRRRQSDPAVDLLFLDLLDLQSRRGHHVSPNPSSTYAPTVFAEMDEAHGHTKSEFEIALKSLMTSGRIRIEETGPPSKRRSRVVRVDP